MVIVSSALPSGTAMSYLLVASEYVLLPSAAAIHTFLLRYGQGMALWSVLYETYVTHKPSSITFAWKTLQKRHRKD